MAMNHKVMLVDDELLVRLGIKSLIDWESHNFEFIGDAADGLKALELMEQEVPDILLTDIVMPNMNGLDLIKEVRRRYPDMLIIVLSSHNEFEYVRSAMKLGVEDYLLKTSMKPEEMTAILVEAARKLKQSGDQARAESTRRTEGQASSKDVITECLLHSLTDEEASVPPGVELPPQCMLLLFHVLHTRDGEKSASSMKLLGHLIQTELAGLLGSEPVSPDNQFIAALLTVPEDRQHDLDRQIRGLVSSAHVLLGLSLRVETGGPIMDWRELSGICRQARSGGLEHGVQLTSREDINTLLRYLKENLTKDISLKEAAERINISETYLSTLFKKETGMGFTDWINSKRIEQAASLLKETSLPSYLIAEQVGYENINYFGRIFKKVKGVSPQKYRSQHQKTII